MHEQPAGHPPGSPAVLMHAGPHVDLGGHHVGDRAVTGAAHHPGSPTFVGPGLGPPDIVTVYDHLAQAGRSGHQQIGGDR